MRLRPIERIILASLCLLCIWTNSALSDTSSQHRSEPWWRTRFVEKQQELRSGPVRLIFLGDSILHSFEWDPKAPDWNHWYGNRGAVDLGFNGDQTEDVIWRVEHGELNDISPKLAVILIGTNDMGKPVAEIAASIESLVKSVKSRLPTTKILVLGILPTGRPEYLQAAAHDVNARLAAAFAGPHAIAQFQNVSCVFRHNGQLRSDLFREHTVPGGPYALHPTPRGMDLLAAAIEPTVSAALADPMRSTSPDTAGNDCGASGDSHNASAANEGASLARFKLTQQGKNH